MRSAANAALDAQALAWHAIPANEVVQRLDGDAVAGLDPAEVGARLARYGPNRLPEAARQSALQRFLLQLRNVLVYILLAAALLKAVMGMWVDTAVFLTGVGLDALPGLHQEGR